MKKTITLVVDEETTVPHLLNQVDYEVMAAFLHNTNYRRRIGLFAFSMIMLLLLLLAVLLSPFNWLYTYSDDSWKFWLGLVLSLMGLITLGFTALVTWIWAIIDMSKRPKEYYKNYYK